MNAARPYSAGAVVGPDDWKPSKTFLAGLKKSLSRSRPRDAVNDGADLLEGGVRKSEGELPRLDDRGDKGEGQIGMDVEVDNELAVDPLRLRVLYGI